MKRTLKYLSDYILLALYAICLYLLSNLAKYGGMRYWMMRILPFALMLIALLVFRIVLRHEGYRAPYFKTRLCIFVALSILFGGKIIHSAIPYNGALSWKIDYLISRRKISFIHNNIYEHGVNGVIQDIEKRITLPEKLYVSDDFRVEFKEDGTITNIDTSLYGENNRGKLKGYLVSYDYKNGNKIDIRINDGQGLSIDNDKLLKPFSEILENLDYRNWIHERSLKNKDQTYVFLYSGRKKVNSGIGLYILDDDGNCHSEFTSSKLSNGGEFIGYEASLFVGNDMEISPFIYLLDPKYVSSETIQNEHNGKVIEEAKSAKNWFTDDADGTLYTFVETDKNIGYRLVVVDAAAGSRFYSLEKTLDGGKTWQSVNENPFMDKAGVAEGIVFFSDDLGFIGIQGPSGQYSQIYMTKDAGLSFRQIILPMGKVTEIPKEGKESGLKLDDYKYISMPERREDKLFVTVKAGSDESTGIEFCSKDSGENWNILEK